MVSLLVIRGGYKNNPVVLRICAPPGLPRNALLFEKSLMTNVCNDKEDKYRD